MTISGKPFDDFRNLLDVMPEASAQAMATVRARDAQLTKPPGSLGRLEEIVEWLAAWQAKAPPTVERPTVVVFAGNHGVTAQGVSPYPPEVTKQMVANFGAGGAAVNQICATFGAGLKVFEMALEIPTKDITQDAAMTEADIDGVLNAAEDSLAALKREAGGLAPVEKLAFLAGGQR